MAQKTNLNINPYYDDFNAGNNFYKVLFNPGRPIQARELTTLQSILQDQLEKFGSNIFKNGAMVVPGNVTFDSNFYAVKLNPTLFGVDVTSYIDKLIGVSLTGQVSGVTATVKLYALPSNDDVDYVTLYVKYTGADNNNNINPFTDGELLVAQSNNIVYNGITISSGTPLVGLIAANATAIGSAASIAEGTYFIRGYFVNVPAQTIILDYYTNTPSYRIGLKITEDLITSYDDSSLYDNAKGFTNYAAPGSDRLKITLTLTKKLTTDFNDTDFIEILRTKQVTIVKDGVSTVTSSVQQIQPKDDYSLIKDYLAKRTYDESGDYTVTPFKVDLQNSLNDRIGNDGLYFNNQTTAQGGTPSDNLMCVKVSPGKAYVRGYDIDKVGVSVIDSPKPRDTKTLNNTIVPFQLGNTLRINNVSGVPLFKTTVDLYDQRKTLTAPIGSKIGDARVYAMTLLDPSYTVGINSATQYALYLFDVQTYTQLQLNQGLSSTDLPATSFVKGQSSGATGYAVFAGSNSNIINLRQTSGTFQVGEQLLINGLATIPTRTIFSVKVFSNKDIKSVYQSTSTSGFVTPFAADVSLEKISFPGLNATDQVYIDSSGNVTSPGKILSGITTNTIIRYQKSGQTLETYNRVTGIGSTGLSFQVTGITTVIGVCDGGLPPSTIQTQISIGAPLIRNQNNGSLYAPLPSPNVSSVNLGGSSLTFTSQITTVSSTGAGSITFNLSSVTGISSAYFLPFNNQRYSIYYSDGTVENLTPDKFVYSGNNITISGLQPSKTIVAINSTLIKSGIQSKVKTYNRSAVLNVTLSKYPQSGSGINTSINDGLTYNQYYGLRVQDEEICLNYPDVANLLAVYESFDSGLPVLDTLSFTPLLNVTGAAIIGENIIGQSSGTVARIVTKPSSNTIGIIYLNANRFTLLETVNFQESNLSGPLQAITLGKFKDITNNYFLDKGQRDQYYDYSKIVRNKTITEPSKSLIIVYDYYTVPSSDSGDVFTVLSYDAARYLTDIPAIGQNQIRSSDTLDFRPYTTPFTGNSSSPFDFASRSFVASLKTIVTPNETSILGYSYYLGRIDKLYLNKRGDFILVNGTSSDNPTPPSYNDDAMEIATITLPPYLYEPKRASIILNDNRRYTMRDIGKIDSRVTNLERVTTLSLLEVNTKSLQIRDAQGLDRFKSGFFVDDFASSTFVDSNYSSIEVDTTKSELRPIISKNTLANQIAPIASISDQNLDLTIDFDLLDPNLVKKKNTVLLKYKEVQYLTQSLATKVENVNPFNVIQYTGTVKLNPANDTWVRTIQTEGRVIEQERHIWLFAIGRRVTLRWDTDVSTQNVLVSSNRELYMRSRNTEFFARNMRPFVKYYQFLDSNSNVDFVPKLLEIATDASLQNYGSSVSFQIGETVVGSFNGVQLIKFRTAVPNHKTGAFNAPVKTYNLNPYARSEVLPASYSASSKILNIDTGALAAEAQGLYSGYVVKGMVLTGQTSGATAYVKDLRLISDEYGDLIGTFFLREPLTNPPPAVRISTGAKTFKLTSSPTDTPPVPGDLLQCSGQTIYNSEGVVNIMQTVKTITRTEYYLDPLAQSFSVGRSISDGTADSPRDDDNGVFITSVDLFFQSKDPGTAPVTVEIRTVELGTPTSNIVGTPTTLTPDQISISNNASVATNVKFESPIYLAPGNEYAIVLLSPYSDEYQVWVAEMGKTTINTANLPNAEGVIYSRQFSLGSLFKSQNGTIWTANQYEDLMFKLYKAEFTSTTGTATFYNPTLDQSNSYVVKLRTNPISTFPRKLNVGIVTTTQSAAIGVLTTGRKVSDASKPYNYGYVTGQGGPAGTVGVTTGGFGYTSASNVSTFAITGSGSGLTLNLTQVGTVITAASIVNSGNGYVIGDVVGIVTSTAGATGASAQLTISSVNGLDTLYLSNVQGSSFTVGGTLVYYDNSGNAVSLAATTIRTSTALGGQNSGQIMGIDHFDHGMYSTSNFVTISGTQSNVPPVLITTNLSLTDTSINVATADTANFTTYEGVSIGSSNPGYVIIDNEIIQYTSVGNGTLNALTRGIDGTISQVHAVGSQMYKYELNGISLRRINTTFGINSLYPTGDGYYLQIGIGTAGGNIDRSSDNGFPTLGFNNQSNLGGTNVYATENIQYDALIPYYNIITPGSSTSASGSIRTVSGTSMGGNEASFGDQGFQPIQLNSLNRLPTTRIVCSKVNETTYLSPLVFPRSRSFTTNIVLSTEDKNLSPMLYLDNTYTEFRSNRLNSPIQNYALDPRVNSLIYDPSAAIYVSTPVYLDQPAKGLKVYIAAYRDISADFRVLYTLIRPNANGIIQAFELFPGYDNLKDTTGSGYGDTIINPSLNSGLPDRYVRGSNLDEFLEYQYTADNLDLFTGYAIKVVFAGTNQALAPRLTSIRTIAIR
jgi:hypothetical protein